MNPRPNDPLMMLAYAGWWLALGLLTYGLLSPEPPMLSEAMLPSYLTYWASKSVHLGAFAGLAAFAGLLTIAPRHQAWLLGTLVVYAPLTEVLQTFVKGRFGSEVDVLINWTGLMLGVGLVRGWRLACAARARRGMTATTTPT